MPCSLCSKCGDQVCEFDAALLVEQKLSSEPELNQRPKDAWNQPLQSSALPTELSKAAGHHGSRDAEAEAWPDLYLLGFAPCCWTRV